MAVRCRVLLNCTMKLLYVIPVQYTVFSSSAQSSCHGNAVQKVNIVSLSWSTCRYCSHSVRWVMSFNNILFVVGHTRDCYLQFVVCPVIIIVLPTSFILHTPHMHTLHMHTFRMLTHTSNIHTFTHAHTLHTYMHSFYLLMWRWSMYLSVPLSECSCSIPGLHDMVVLLLSAGAKGGKDAA